MALLFRKFQEAVKVMAKNPMFARDPRHLQFEADMNKLLLYTCYNRLGRDVDDKDIDEIIDIASKASIADQQKQVQENIHTQVQTICETMEGILRPDEVKRLDSHKEEASGRPSGLSWAVGGGRVVTPSTPVIPKTLPLARLELSDCLKRSIGYTLEVKPSLVPHEDAGDGLFVTGEAEAGSVIAIYPGIIYSPAYYRHIPGYPRIDASNSYLITRYDGIIINAQPWGLGGEGREVWDGASHLNHTVDPHEDTSSRGSDRMWRMLSKPLESSPTSHAKEVLERRNPFAFGHFANHPPKGQTPNVMVCPYDFPLSKVEMRPYIPNIVFGTEENVKMKRLGNFWFKTGTSGNGEVEGPVLKSLVLVATRTLCDEEVLLNYRLSNSKRWPTWYAPVNEEEDRRRWS